MKKVLFAIVGMIVLPVAAELAPDWYWQEQTQAQAQVEQPAEAPAAPAAPALVPLPPASVAAQQRAAVARSQGRAPGQAAGRNAIPGRTVAARTAVSGPQTVAPGASRAAPVRARAASAAGTVTPSARPGVQPNASAARAAVAGQPTIYSPSNVASRISIAPMAGGVARTSTVRPTTSEQQIAETGPTMEELAQVTDFCRAQYTSCMDGFCAVVDENQGRCACSVNVARYEDNEIALRNATEELQKIAVNIQYLGLTKDEVQILFNETEAELAMRGTTYDSSEIATSLAAVGKMIDNIGQTRNQTSGGFDMSFDSGIIQIPNLDDIFAGNFSLTSFLGGNTGGSVQRQRGEALVNSAKSRCNSILTDCQAQGVNTGLITGYYDMEIDRQCVVYERALTEANANMRRTVLNAQHVLRNARLQVARNQNQFDARGCVNALDSCMQNDFVCGRDYENCLDPTGNYVVNGRIVIGSKPGTVLNLSEQTGTPQGLSKIWGTSESGRLVVELTGVAWSNGKYTGGTGTNKEMLLFILNKIGHIDSDGKAHGMCSSVMNRCQNVTRVSNDKKYATDNIVIREFLARAFIQVKAGQERVLANFAESCVQDVRTCLSSNNTLGAWTSASVEDNPLHSTAKNACSPVATTCASAVGMKTTGTVNDFMECIWSGKTADCSKI